MYNGSGEALEELMDRERGSVLYKVDQSIKESPKFNVPLGVRSENRISQPPPLGAVYSNMTLATECCISFRMAL